MRVVVAGGTGFIGGHLLRELLEAGHEVTALSRHPDRHRGKVDARARLAEWDATAPEPLAPLVAEADAVINLVGEPISGRWTDEKKRQIWASRVRSTAAIAQALRDAPARPRVLLNASAVGYYGNRGEEELTEEAPPGRDFLASVCVEWEAAARQAEDAARVVRMRTGVVLGREGGALPQMLGPFQMGVGGSLGSGRQWFPWVHVADVAGLYRFAMENEAARGPLNAVAPEAVRMETFCRTLAGVLRRPCALHVPVFILRLALGELADAVLASQHVQPAVAQRLGYEFRFPQLEPALRDLVG